MNILNRFVRYFLHDDNISIKEDDVITEDLLKELIGKDDPVILDIGCNDGSQSLWLSKMFSNAQVYSFEPDPRARRRFLENVGEKGVNIRLFDIAISDRDGEIDFYCSDGAPDERWREICSEGWDLSGSIRRPKRHLDFYKWCEFNETIKVRAMKLDTWCCQNYVNHIDFIWADVQGAEVDLIRGGREALSHTRYFYTEYNDNEMYEGQLPLRKILRLIPSYKVLHRYKDDVLLKNERYTKKVFTGTSRRWNVRK